ncbi:MAG: site-2 protease family protein, partial [Candidatus Kapabacteria bacterium]|nr:site-2 protease family protein [Candidatus Kapabacteria bacterium]
MQTDYYLKRSKVAVLKPYIIFFLLLTASFVTCMIAGTQWAYQNFYEITNWHYGIEYAVLIILFLSAHEFGHYFAAKYHKVEATLPYYIPFPFTIALNFGTLGAVIRTKTPIPSRKALFDIGVSGPIAGFIVASGFLIYGLMTLPGVEFIYNIHPDYVGHFGGVIPDSGLFFGDTLYLKLLTLIFANPDGFMPPMNEIYHYPFLNVGWFGLFVTSLNMLPMGQLDGGHAIYSMFGRKTHQIVSVSVFRILLAMGLISMLGLLYEFFSENFDNTVFIAFKNIFFPALNYLKE